MTERDAKVQELKDNISQLNLERTELITKVHVHESIVSGKSLRVTVHQFK